MARYVRSGDVEAAPMLEETILYSPAAHRFCVLNPTAAYLWEKLAEPVTLESLAAGLRHQFDANGNPDVEADLRTALERLEGLNMIRQVNDV